MIVNTLEELGEQLGRDKRVFSDWRKRGVNIPAGRAPKDVEKIRQQAIALGLGEGLGREIKGAPVNESTGSKANGTGATDSKMKEAASVYALKQRIANLELTNAKIARINQEMKEREKNLVPVAAIYPGLNDLATQLRDVAVQLLKRGNEEATEAAHMIQDRIVAFEAKVKTIFGTGASEE